MQTSTGPYFSRSGTALYYRVDTEPANPGSPVISGDFTIGIHVTGGCAADSGANVGTSFDLDVLENAIAAVPGANCRYLDTVQSPTSVRDGTVFRPHITLIEAVSAVPIDGRLSVVRGNYFTSGMTITKNMTITAPVGPVTFSN